jgi:hypothetical protein
MTAEIAKIIEDGLKWYEEELWHDRPKTAMEKSMKLRYQTQVNCEEKSSANEDEVTNQNVRSQDENSKSFDLYLSLSSYR